MIGHELKRDDCENSLETVDNWRDGENLVAESAQVFGQTLFANKYWLALVMVLFLPIPDFSRGLHFWL